MSDENKKSGFMKYVKHRLPDAENISLDSFERIHGGASRQTYRLKLTYTRNGVKEEKGLILRIDPEKALIETEHAMEYMFYKAFHGSTVPVPAPVWLEEDGKWLGGAFFVMEEITGCETSPAKIAEPPFDRVREKIGETYCWILGQISKADPEKIGLLKNMDVPKPDECWKRELDYWEQMIEQDELEPQPVARAAIRWLRRTPPPPAQKISIIHGDYRIGNFLYDEKGKIHGILDWEMCHMGDPIEDLAYGFNLLWTSSEPNMVGCMINRERAIGLWEESSGLKCDPDAFRWWDIFSSVKGVAIWVDAARKFYDGTNRDIILGHTGWVATDIQSFILMSQLGIQ